MMSIYSNNTQNSYIRMSNYHHHEVIKNETFISVTYQKADLMSSNNIPLLNILADAGAYRSRKMSAPPAEKRPHVMPFELTTGCSYNACNFCSMYRGEDHSIRSFGEYAGHVQFVWENLEPSQIEGLTRIFIGSGNALCADTKTLNQVIQYSAKSFLERTGRIPRRIAMYGNTNDILSKNTRDLRILNCGSTCITYECSKYTFGRKVGLNLLYWGIESGSDDVLRFANKGYDKFDLQVAISRLRALTDDGTGGNGIRTSVMIMPGLGGVKHYKSHVVDTADVLNELQPSFVTFLGINPGAGSKYARKMANEQSQGTNRQLTQEELTEQMADMIELFTFNTTVGCFDKSVHSVGINPQPFGSKKLQTELDRTDLVDQIRGKQTDDSAQRISEFLGDFYGTDMAQVANGALVKFTSTGSGPGSLLVPTNALKEKSSRADSFDGIISATLESEGLIGHEGTTEDLLRIIEEEIGVSNIRDTIISLRSRSK